MKSDEYKALNYETHHVTTGVDCETNTVLERIEAVKNNLNITPKEVIADRGYGSGENLSELKKKKIKTNIRLWNNSIRKSF